MKKQTILTITILGLLATVAHSIDAKRSNHHRRRNHVDRDTAIGVLAGAGTGGTIAGVAGSAKWVPLGLGIGAVGGYFAIKLLKNHLNNNAHKERQYETQTNRRRHVRPAYQEDDESYIEKRNE